MPEGTILVNSNNPTQNINSAPPGPSMPLPIPIEEQVPSPNQNPVLGSVPQAPVFTNTPQSPLSSSPPPVEVNHGKGFFGRYSKIIKIGVLILIIFTFVFVFLNLVNRKSKNTENSSVTLTYWGLWEDASAMKPVIADFEKENPNIKVNYLVQDPKEYKDKLDARVPNGNGPDIFRFHNTWYPMLKNVLLPLPKEAIERKEFEDNYYNVAQSDLIKSGAIYGIPLEIDTLVLYVNTQIFDQASQESGVPIVIPATWQDFINTSQSLTKRDGEGGIDIAGAAMGVYDNVNHAPDIISLLFAQNGVDFSDLSSSESRVSDALRFYSNFALLENNVWDQTFDSSLTAFSQGKLAMYFGYSSDYSAIKALNPNLSIKVVPVPQLLSEKKANIASYWVEGVSSRSKHQKEAILFMKYLAKPNVQEEIYKESSKIKSFGEPYSNKNLANKLKGSEAYIFVSQATDAVSSPFVDGTYDKGLNEKLNNYLNDSIDSILSGTAEDSATGVLINGYSQVLSEY